LVVGTEATTVTGRIGRIRRTSPTDRRAATDRGGRVVGADAFREHLPSLFSIASFLLAEPAEATEAVRRALTSVNEGSAAVVSREEERAMLAATVYRCCADVVEARGASTRGSGPLPPVGAPCDLERSALALVMFGGHSYRDAASVLGLEPAVVADRLRSGLHRFRHLLELAPANLTP